MQYTLHVYACCMSAILQSKPNHGISLFPEVRLRAREEGNRVVPTKVAVCEKSRAAAEENSLRHSIRSATLPFQRMNTAFRIGEQLFFFLSFFAVKCESGRQREADSKAKTERHSMSGPDELGTSASVKLAACEPLAAAMEALNGKAAGSKQDKRGGKPSLVFVAPLSI